MEKNNTFRRYVLIVGNAIELAWFFLVGAFFMLQVLIVPLFQRYAIMYVHEMDKRVRTSSWKAKTTK